MSERELSAPLPPGTPPDLTEREDPDSAAKSAEREEEASEAQSPEGDEKEEQGTEGDDKDDQKSRKEKGKGKELSPAPAPGVHKGTNGWQAVWSQEASAYYFWNEEQNITTWENPLAGLSPAASREDSKEVTKEDLGGIDPELAFLDPSLAQRTPATGAPSFKAQFNSRTGRFQADPSMNPDRISEYSRGERQQQVFYDTKGWQESLGGRGIKRAADEDGLANKKKVSSKDVVRLCFPEGSQYTYLADFFDDGQQ
ncbi:hypothetical protein T439DRAFT_140063 [Meredithblackwellia eburnea MCA 4105]